jgi:hypothetical protein
MGQFDLTSLLSLMSLLLLILSAQFILSHVLLLSDECLIFTLLISDSLKSLLVIVPSWLILTVQVCQSLLSLGHIFSQNSVDVVVLLLLLRLKVFLPSRLEYLL